MDRPHVRTLMISECAARSMARNKIWPSEFAIRLVKEACHRAGINRLNRKAQPTVWVHIERTRGLHPGRYGMRYCDSKPTFKGFSYRAGNDRIVYENANHRFHYKESARGRVQVALVADWIPESVCAAIGGQRINDIVENDGLFFQHLNPVVVRARNGMYRGGKAVIFTLKVAFETSFWDKACPPDP